MKALVYDGPGQREWRDVPQPSLLEPTDAVVRVDAVSSTPSEPPSSPSNWPITMSGVRRS